MNLILTGSPLSGQTGPAGRGSSATGCTPEQAPSITIASINSMPLRIMRLTTRSC